MKQCHAPLYVILYVLYVILSVLCRHLVLDCISVRLHQSQHPLFHPLLPPFADIHAHVGIVSEGIRQQSVVTMEVTLKLAHVVCISVAVAAYAEYYRQCAVAPEVFTHSLHARHQCRHVRLRGITLWHGRLLLTYRRARHGKYAARDVAVKHLAVRACRKMVHNIFLTSFFHFFFSFFFLVNLPVTLSLNTCALHPCSKWL